MTTSSACAACASLALYDVKCRACRLRLLLRMPAKEYRSALCRLWRDRYQLSKSAIDDTLTDLREEASRRESEGSNSDGD